MMIEELLEIRAVVWNEHLVTKLKLTLMRESFGFQRIEFEGKNIPDSTSKSKKNDNNNNKNNNSEISSHGEPTECVHAGVE